MASTVSANTADVAYALDIGGSQPASINGGGSVDLATQGSNLSLTYTLGGQSFPEQIVYDGGQGFYDLGAIVHYVTPGYDWVSMDLAPGGSRVPASGSAVSLPIRARWSPCWRPLPRQRTRWAASRSTAHRPPSTRFR